MKGPAVLSQVLFEELQETADDCHISQGRSSLTGSTHLPLRTRQRL